MQALIDHAIALLVGGMIVLSLLVLRVRGQDGSADAVQYRAAKKDLLAFATMVGQDFKNIGANLTAAGTAYRLNPRDAITVWDTLDGSPEVQRLEFRTMTDPGQSPKTVRYEWNETGEEVTLRDGTVRPLLDVRRLVNGVLTARSTGRVTEFFVELRPGPGVPFLINLRDTRAINVRIRAVSPFGAAGHIEETRFEATYRPVNLTR